MTSVRSLNKKKGAAYTFFSALKSGLAPLIAEAVVLLLSMVALPFSQLSSLAKSFREGHTKISPKETYRYLIFGQGRMEAPTTILILAVIAVCAIALAIIIFRFMSDKRTVNVYYSLGVKRSTLYRTNYLAGLFGLLTVPAAACILSYFVNIIYLKMNWQLSVALFSVYLGIAAFTVLCFTITGAVFASVGTVGEGVVFSLGILGLPTMLLICFDNLSSAFLSSYAGTYSIRTADGQYLNEGSSMLTEYSNWNPVLFSFNLFNNYGSATYEKDVVVNAAGSVWHFPAILNILMWLVVSVGIYFLGMIFFRRRKAENCGFLNINKFLSITVMGECLLFASCLFIEDIRYYDSGYRYQIIIPCAVAFFVVYILFEIFLKRNIKKILTALYKLPAFAVVVCLVIGIFATGGLGFEKWVPSASDVESINVSTPCGMNFATIGNYLNYDQNGVIRVNINWELDCMPEITDRADIEKIIKIHSQLSGNQAEGDGTSTKIAFCYKMKNGDTKQRVVSINDKQALTTALALYDTSALRTQLTNLLTRKWGEKEIDIDFYNSNYSEYATSWLSRNMFNAQLISEDLGNHTYMELTPEKKTQLREAVHADLTAGNIGDYFTYTGKQYGVLRFESDAAFRDEIRKFDILNSGFVEESTTEETTAEETTVETTAAEELSTLPEETLPEEWEDEGYSDEGAEEWSSGDEDFFGEDFSDDTMTEEPTQLKAWKAPEIKPLGMISEEVTNSYEYIPDMVDTGCLQDLCCNETFYDFIISDRCVNTLKLINEWKYGDALSPVKEKTIVAAGFGRWQIPDWYRNVNVTFETTAYSMTLIDLCENYIGYYAPDSSKIKAEEVMPEIMQNATTDKERLAQAKDAALLHGYTYGEGYVALFAYSDGTVTSKFIPEDKAPDFVKNFSYEDSFSAYYY